MACTPRAFLTGLLLSAFIGVGAVWNLMVIHGSYVAIDFSAAAATFLFFVWAFLVNGAAARWSAGWALSGAELKLVYVMMLVACAIPTMGLTAQLLPIVTAPYYFATPENNWAELIQPHIPVWLLPSGKNTIRDFYEGLQGIGQPIPWIEWLRPLSIWTIFLSALYVVSISMMVILRRQWMEHERLVYPLAQLPVEMADRPDSAAVSATVTVTVAIVASLIVLLRDISLPLLQLKGDFRVLIFDNDACRRHFHYLHIIVDGGLGASGKSKGLFGINVIQRDNLVIDNRHWRVWMPDNSRHLKRSLDG